MGRCLIVANQTLGTEQLHRATAERIERGDVEFFVVVPMIDPVDEATGWPFGFEIDGDMTTYGIPQAIEREERRREEAFEAASERAEIRLMHMITAIQNAGGKAEGEIGDTDPVVAVRDAMPYVSFDEILVSTLPTRLSRWLRMDLPSRLSRLTDVPVTTVEAEE